MKASDLIGKLRKRRRKLKMTQKELGDLLHISDSYISLMENEKRGFRLEDFTEIAEKLGLEITIEEKGNDQT